MWSIDPGINKDLHRAFDMGVRDGRNNWPPTPQFYNEPYRQAYEGGVQAGKFLRADVERLKRM